jgi:phage RecT family recombinase
MSNLLTIESYKGIKPSFIKLSNEKTFIREVNFAIQALKKNTYLQSCDINSVLEAVLNISQTSLTLNPVLNYAYLVPHKGKCVLYPGYQGLVKLATETGTVTSIEVQLIYQGDDIEIDLASSERVKKHIPYILTGKDKGMIIGGYSIAMLPDGSKHIEIMSLSDIHAVRECSESYKYDVKKGFKNSPWNNNMPEMSRKTILKRHFKYLPKSDKNESLTKAIELDNKDYDFPMTYSQGNYIDSLLISSTLEGAQAKQILDALTTGMTQKRAEECIEYLKENQLDAIDAGGNYSQGDIQNKLSQLKG